MANISEAISRGTQQNTQAASRMGAQMQQSGEQGRRNIKDTMEMEAHQFKRQAIFDEKAGGWMQTHAALKNNHSVAVGAADKNRALMVDADPEIAKKARAAMPGLDGAVTTSSDQLAKLIEGTTRDHRMSEILKRSSYSNSDLEEILNGVMSDPNVSDERKAQINANVSMIQQVQQQLQEQEQAEQNAIAAQQAGEKYAAQTRAFHEETGAYTAGQLSKQTAAAEKEESLQKGKPGTQWFDMSTLANIKDTPLVKIQPYLESAASDMKAEGLLPGHFNAASDEINSTMGLIGEKWGEIVAGGGTKTGRMGGKYPDPRKMAPQIRGAQTEYKAARDAGVLSEQAFKFYDAHISVLNSISNEYGDADAERKAELSEAYGEYIRRTISGFPSSPKARTVQSRGSDQS